MRRLIEELLLPAFRSDAARARHDGAVLPLPGGDRLAFTTDGYVVRPRTFPGGDIGSLSVCGTINDLAVTGARPLALSAGLIIEEGLPRAELDTIIHSMAGTARRANVEVVTGDTKVVERGSGDGIFIHTAGVGLVPAGTDLRPARVQPGDAVLVSGDLGRHGIAVLSVREGLGFEGAPHSDVAPLHELTAALVAAQVDLHCLRDLTRGGLASACNEIASDAKVHIRLDEAAIPIHPGVRGASELLGLDPLYIACEGRLIAFCPAHQADRALAAMRAVPVAADAARIGTVTDDPTPMVTLRGPLGTERVLDLLTAPQLPRIC
jgi:hydrogenase expression/formation protein HypE